MSDERTTGAQDSWPRFATVITGSVGCYFGASVADAQAREADPNVDGPDMRWQPGDTVQVIGPSQAQSTRQPDTGVVTSIDKYPVSTGDGQTYWCPSRNLEFTDSPAADDGAQASIGGGSGFADLLLLMVLFAVAKVG